MQIDFDAAVSFVLRREGGLVDNPADPGGLTNMGIALAEHPSMTAAQIRSLTRTEAIAIYEREYWTPISGNELPRGIDFVAFDCAVNQGVGTAIHLMQQAAGVTADGVIGPVTLNALRTYDMTHLIADFTVARLQAYREDAGWPTFGDGWTKRAILAALEAPQQLSYTDQRL